MGVEVRVFLGKEQRIIGYAKRAITIKDLRKTSIAIRLGDTFFHI